MYRHSAQYNSRANKNKNKIKTNLKYYIYILIHYKFVSYNRENPVTLIR